MEEITWTDFERIVLCVGTITDAQDFPKVKKPAYQLQIDFGAKIGIRKSSAQITVHYTRDELIGKQVVAVVNFPRKQIANFFSECLVTGFADANGDIVLTAVDKEVPNGTRLM
ncbi:MULTISPECIES: tRNA-binding protein [Sphingobacterium]|uniref:tRNA-binding protein n=1 Tax=Sphingobacterium populi TaxID=1812824 RepID=A0ABW5UCW3_9SPHI|nr:tRNA-binding protein [Sphingobacterium sp. CFCC 11742]